MITDIDTNTPKIPKSRVVDTKTFYESAGGSSQKETEIYERFEQQKSESNLRHGYT